LDEPATRGDIHLMEQRLIKEIAEVGREVMNHNSTTTVAAAKIIGHSELLLDHAEKQTAIMAETLAAVRTIAGIDWVKVARGAALMLLFAVSLGVVLGRAGADILLGVLRMVFPSLPNG